MANNRIFYAVQAVGIGSCPTGSGSITSEGSGFRWMKGVQSVGITTNFNLEQVFEVGQLELYQNVENVPEIEVTIEKVIDGRHGLYLQSVGLNGTGNIVNAANQRCDVWLAIYPDTNSSASGTAPETLVYCSGMRVSNVTYTLPVEGNSTESVTLVGNDKKWYNTAAFGSNANINTGFATISNSPHAPNTSVARRQNFNATKSSIPSTVSGAIRGGIGNIQNVTITADFARDNIYELGSFRPYYKYARYPIGITCDFEVMSISGDKVQASGDAFNLTPETIKVVVDTNGTGVASGELAIDIGGTNKLTSVNYSGADTGGGNATVRYSYQTFNKFLVTDSYAGNGNSDGVTGDYWTVSQVNHI
jgi:hypothetical protein